MDGGPRNYMYMYVSDGGSGSPMGRATFGRLGRAQTDFPEVDALNVHNVIHKGTAAMRPLTVVTTATCFTYLHTSVGYRLTHGLIARAEGGQSSRRSLAGRTSKASISRVLFFAGSSKDLAF